MVNRDSFDADIINVARLLAIEYRVFANPITHTFLTTACFLCTRIQIHRYCTLLNPCGAKRVRNRICKNTLMQLTPHIHFLTAELGPFCLFLTSDREQREAPVRFVRRAGRGN